MKKTISAVFMILFCVVAASIGASAEQINVTLDGKSLQLTSPPVIVDGRTLLALREICEAAGATVNWDNDTNSAVVNKNDIEVTVPVDKKCILINNVKNDTDVAAAIINDRTYLPIRPVLEALGYNVSWDGKTNTVIIDKLDKKTLSFIADDRNIDVDLYWGLQLFNRSASEYNHNLAMAGLLLSWETEAGKNCAESAMKGVLNFENPQSYSYDGFRLEQPAVTIAHKGVEIDGKKKEVIAVAIRGTETGSGDLLTDFSSQINGVYDSGQYVRDCLKSYISTYCKNSSLNERILYICGHSLGGACSCLLSASSGEFATKENTFVYAFAAPNHETFQYDVDLYTNVHNVINVQDVVPNVPLGYKKYGHKWYYDADDSKFDKAVEKIWGSSKKTIFGLNSPERDITWFEHLCETYLACIITELPNNMGTGTVNPYGLWSVRSGAAADKKESGVAQIGWPEAYKNYYDNKTYLYHGGYMWLANSVYAGMIGTGEFYFGLYDFENDGIPEMVIYAGCDSKDTIYLFGYENGNVEAKGRLNTEQVNKVSSVPIWWADSEIKSSGWDQFVNSFE